MDATELANRFQFHAATTTEKLGLHGSVRLACGDLSKLLNKVLPEGREKALAMTHLEEVMMWGNAALARHPHEGGDVK